MYVLRTIIEFPRFMTASRSAADTLLCAIPSTSIVVWLVFEINYHKNNKCHKFYNFFLAIVCYSNCIL